MTPVDCAIQKINAVIETIVSASELDFPYQHPKDALAHIHEIFRQHLEHLSGITSPEAASAMCRTVSEDIDNYLYAAGFIVRASDLRGALELQGPLLRLTHRAIGPDVKLVISSEWGFSPFTLLYPGEFGSKFVLVGLPVSEAGNPLIAPLAGHELGHNIWVRLPKLKAYVASRLKDQVIAIIKSEYWDEFSSIFNCPAKEQLDQDDLFDTTSWQTCKVWAAAQCEEMFSDFVGLCFFGEAYLQAFRYLLSPGGGLRTPTYPDVRKRVRTLVEAAKQLGFAVPPKLDDEFDEADVTSELRQQLLIRISDHAAQSLVPELIQSARKWCETRGVMVHDVADTNRIYESFKEAIPATNAKSLSNIINAAWRISLDKSNPWANDYPVTETRPEKRTELLRELALKSFEVFEIERIQETHNAPLGE